METIGMAAPERNAGLSRIKTAMIEKKMTQAELADAADCHEKTIQNLLHGRSVRDQTLFDVCMVLGLDFEELKSIWSAAPVGRDEPGRPSAAKDIAPVYMGAYSREAVDHYVGSYLTLRPSFTRDGACVAYRTDITWDPDWPSLLFEEADRPDASYAHRGRLYIPASSQFIHLVSLTKGSMRMVTVSQLDREGQMRGLITTLNKQKAMLVPVSTPIVYTRRDTFAPDAFGEIGPGQPHYAAYQAVLLDTTTQGYVKLIG
jgi:transcriptional regulator with XRE-family HTH domain